jgi:hypothetical protein
MLVDINRLIDAYGGFEQRIRQEMERRSRVAWAVCRQVCCRALFCVETRESIFLARVAKRYLPHAGFDPVHGWLGLDSCSLVAGRPPVCYEFLCRDIPDTMHGDPLRRHATLTLSMLVTHLGKRPVGGRHLVELTNETALIRIAESRLSAHLSQAEAAFNAVGGLLDGELPDDATALLSRIIDPPRVVSREMKPATQRAKSRRRKM